MQAIRTWWGQRFIAALEQFTDTARLARGRSYANDNRIKSWALKNGTLSAKIRGNKNPYFGVYKEPTYETAISLKSISATDWALLIHHLGSRAGYISRLLLNEMPDHIERPFKSLDLHLLPHSAKDFKTSCSCPDYENPCKHIAGLCYFLSSKLDENPFLLFELRGLSPEQLLEKLRQTPLGAALALAREKGQAATLDPVESYFTRPRATIQSGPCSLDTYWQSPKRLPETIVSSAQATVPALLIKKGGDFPAFWKEPQPLPTIMEEVYGAIRKKVKAW